MRMDAKAMNAVYEMARDIYHGKADVNICQAKAFELYGVAPRSFAGWFVPMFKRMRNGITFKGSAPIPLIEVYLRRIYQEYGCDGLRKALESYKGTIQYYEQRGTNKPGDREIYEKYLRILHNGRKEKPLARRELK